MEYVAGESLARLLRVVRSNNQLVPAPIAASILVGVLHGLHAAHEARDERGDPLRIVHRDVSPHNILVGTDGAAHVIDFGVAKARGRMQVTQQGQIKGKLSYMPAEQLLGHGLDHRADIFAASIVLWEALTGQRLFQGTDDGEIYAKVLLGHVDPPSLHAPGLEPAVDAIVLRGLARDREQRYATARDMALAIESAMPLAPPSQVGSWVEGLVGDALTERTEQIADIERDDSDAGSTPSAMISITPGIPLSGLAPRGRDDGGGRRRSGRPDQTALTRPSGGRARNVTAPTSPMLEAVPPVPPAEDSLAAVSGVPGRLPRRAILAVGFVVLALGVFGARRAGWMDRGTGVAPPRQAPLGDSRPAAPQSPPAQASAGWIPVMPLPGATGTDVDFATNPGSLPTANSGPSKRWTGIPLPSARATVPQAARPSPETTLSVAGSPGATPKPASCDPPFWIDADGTKRYNHNCTSP
jgi:serine/threonine-protein kinase